MPRVLSGIDFVGLWEARVRQTIEASAKATIEFENPTENDQAILFAAPASITRILKVISYHVAARVPLTREWG